MALKLKMCESFQDGIVNLSLSKYFVWLSATAHKLKVFVGL